jgi:D-glycero-alpha-D-manno-heptose-7-phosphate kinase
MFTSRTPYRVSFFGGGTDYSHWYKENGGAFISMGIDKYCYLNVRALPPFFDYNNRIVWSKIEQVKTIDEIVHPAIRKGLQIEGVRNVELHHIGDLPARSGLGSSSSFSVGLLHVLRRFKGYKVDKYALAKDAIRLERVLLNEAGGIQDQIAAAYGGFNFVEIQKDGNFKVNPLNLSADSQNEFENSLLLVFTGIFRNSYELASEQVASIAKSYAQLQRIHEITLRAKSIYESREFVEEFGCLLNETWQAKKAINDKISNSTVDEIYDAALEAGAYGGKLLGSGAGGFMIFVVPQSKMKLVRSALKGLVQTSVKIDQFGTQCYQRNSGELV